MTAWPAPDISAFDGLCVIRPLSGGHRNAVWLATGPQGPLVIKSTTRTEAQLAWLLPVQTAARGAGFVVPGLIPASDGRFAPNGWTVERFIEGRAASPEELHGLGPRVTAFHAACALIEQRPGFRCCLDLLNKDRGGDVDMTCLPDPVATACRIAWAPFARAVTQPIHGDLGVGNVIQTPQGPALIDWDEARRDLGIFDRVCVDQQTKAEAAAHLAWEVACGWRREPEHARLLAVRLVAWAAQAPDQDEDAGRKFRA